METGDAIQTSGIRIGVKNTYNFFMQQRKISTAYSFICAIITIFVLKNKILYYPFAFIIFDILGSVFYCIYNIFWINTVYSKMSSNEKFDYCENQINNLYHLSFDSKQLRNLRSESISALRLEQERIRAYQEEEEEKEARLERSKSDNIEIENYYAVLNEFKSKQSVIRNDDNKEKLSDLNKTLKDIIKLVEEKTATSLFCNKLFNIYLPELVVLISNTPKDKEQQKQYKDNVMEVIDEIIILAENTQKNILNFNQKTVDISFDVLKKEIRKSNEDLTE